MEDTGLGEEIQADEDVQKYSGTASDPAGEGNTGTTLPNSPEPSNLSLSAKIEFFNKLRDQKISCEATGKSIITWYHNPALLIGCMLPIYCPGFVFTKPYSISVSEFVFLSQRNATENSQM